MISAKRAQSFENGILLTTRSCQSVGLATGRNKNKKLLFGVYFEH